MSLADLSAQIRAALKWFLIIPLVIFFLWLAWIGVREVTKEVFKPRGAETAYGNLAPPFFTKTFSPLQADQFELAASLPKAGSKINVFQTETDGNFTEKQQKGLLSFFGLTGNEKTTAGNIITWRGTSATLTLDASQSHFSYRLDLSKGISSLAANVGLDKNQALKKAQEILKKLGSLPKDIEQDDAAIRFFTLSADKHDETSASAANAVEVNFFRKVKSARSDGDPLIRMMLTETGNKIVEFDYNYYPLNPTASAYPIIDSNQAWQELQAGKAFSESDKQFDLIKVAKINLSYWESKFYQPYLQPVWVFSVKGETKGAEKEFNAYLPAINPSFFWEKESPTSPP